ncbi:unnamed protein product, partial [Phaeothamnion confervicola]
TAPSTRQTRVLSTAAVSWRGIGKTRTLRTLTSLTFWSETPRFPGFCLQGTRFFSWERDSQRKESFRIGLGTAADGGLLQNRKRREQRSFDTAAAGSATSKRVASYSKVGPGRCGRQPARESAVEVFASGRDAMRWQLAR